MIRKLTEVDRTNVLEYLSQEPAINIFLIGDIENYGFDKDYQDVYAEFIDGVYNSVVLKYKENILYFCHKDYFNPDWVELFDSIKHQFISGKKSLTDLIKPYFNDAKAQEMYFCELRELPSDYKLDDTNIIEARSEEDCGLMFDFLKEITEFQSMKNQKKDDYVNSKFDSLKHSKAYYIKDNNKCVSTVSTVADTKTSAMIVGVATHIDHRNKGYASKLMIKLLHEYTVNRKKSVCLFYDNPKAGSIYKRLGFVDKDMWVMLVRK